MSTAQELITIALAEVGYKEKSSNANLDDKTANSGSANYTKYARDLAKAGYYNANKNGYAWCDVFVDWCFYKAFGSKGQEIQCQTGPYGAGCTFSMQYFKQQGRLDTIPQLGDQIFFRYSGSSGADHTGIVVEITDSKITTVEGNSSNQVKKNTYARSNSTIVGYGHPKYDGTATETKTEQKAKTDTSTAAKETGVSVSLTQLSKGSTGAQVKTVQRILRTYGVDNSLAIDGHFGAITKNAVINAQKKLFPSDSSECDGIVGKNTWKGLLTQLG